MTSGALDTYAAALDAAVDPGSADDWFTRTQDGARHPLGADLRRWCAPADRVDRELLQHCPGAVLDVGCGPGRLVAELARQGRHGAGVDSSAAAVDIARAAGGPVLHRSLFDPVPGEGRWDSVVLADGNIGIGGDPVALLARCGELIAPDGRVVVELSPPGTGRRIARVRLERDGLHGDWFDWALVGTDAAHETAAAADLVVAELWRDGDRWFASLVRLEAAAGDLDLAS
ncbi:bifunctional 2-polyprenyl-6-hydroxyphenol methylase/3-demethylubiquinol 3-O-methyltransferase UbiG [Blastococcus sp. TF02A-26]|uniref:class I SAM-dependent methyltransferase n=1 Tax=Blastococcus sp. TF02A-26 TaxID=2250577 RepID=UPI000DE8E027|nr:methyltransferase domain-containing protein [Blastococcus sp. TF02A-26]RBY86202.1 SAM-dependent methyltransferase [Blastococcus sp. TF02A-26]